MTSHRFKLLLPILIVAFAIAIAIVLVLTRPVAAREAIETPAPLVRAVPVSLAPATLQVRAQGTLAPERQTELFAQVSGRITEVSPSFALGAKLDPGALIVRIDPRDYQLAVEQARAGLAQATVRLERERAEADLARREWEELGEGEASPLTLRVPQLAEAEAAVAAAAAAVAKAELDLDRTAIRAPFAGRVALKLVELGQLVGPATPIGRIFSTSSAEIELAISPEEARHLDLAALERGETIPVELSTASGGDQQTWTGTVVRSTGRVDERTRLLGLIARVEAPYAVRSDGGQPLQMGQFVDAVVLGRTVPDVASLPRAALRGRDAVLVVDPERRLRFRTVEVLQLGRDEVLISAGLEEGELVLISTLETPVEGTRVTLADANGEPLR